jgi:hypothetical protein
MDRDWVWGSTGGQAVLAVLDGMGKSSTDEQHRELGPNYKNAWR